MAGFVRGVDCAQTLNKTINQSRCTDNRDNAVFFFYNFRLLCVVNIYIYYCYKYNIVIFRCNFQSEIFRKAHISHKYLSSIK